MYIMYFHTFKPILYDGFSNRSLNEKLAQISARVDKKLPAALEDILVRTISERMYSYLIIKLSSWRQPRLKIVPKLFINY